MVVSLFRRDHGIGLYLRGFTKTGEISSWRAQELFLGCRPALPVGQSRCAGDPDTGGTTKYGMFVSHWYWLGAIPAMLFLGLTMPFYYSRRSIRCRHLKLRYDERTRLLNAISFAATLLMSGSTCT